MSGINSRRLVAEWLESRWALDAAGAASIDPMEIAAQHTETTYIAPSRRMDVDGDGVVGPRDVKEIIDALNANDGSLRLDVSADSIVSPLDALLVINEYNAAGHRDLLTPPTNQDIETYRNAATRFAAEISEVLPDDELVALIAEDFARMRQSYPHLDVFAHRAPKPGSIALFLDAEAWERLDSGTSTALQSLNDELGGLSITTNGRHSVSLSFEDPYNAGYLAKRYQELKGVVGVANEAAVIDIFPNPNAIHVNYGLVSDGREFRTYGFGGIILGVGFTTKVTVSDSQVRLDEFTSR